MGTIPLYVEGRLIHVAICLFKWYIGVSADALIMSVRLNSG